MNSRARILLIAVLAGMSGCSSVPFVGEKTEPTIGSLDRDPQWPAVPPVKLEDSRQAAMDEYERFLEDPGTEELVPEAMRRLADLHLLEEQDAVMLGEQEPAPGTSRSAELYKELLTRFPDHPHSESALYQMARALDQSGDPQPTMAALTSFSEKYTGSEKYDEVQFRRGERLFVRRDYFGAETAYQAVLDQGPESTFHQQALYKIGWARFKQHNYVPALDAYTQLLDETIGDHDGSAMPEGLERADRERIQDTLRAISLSFAYLGTHEEVSNYFGQRGARAYEPLIYAQLAGLHLAKERYTDAADTYSRFAEMHPQHREAPLFQSRVIDVYKKAGFHQRVLEEKQAFVVRYEPASDYWRNRSPEEVPEVLDQVQRHLRDIAQHFHAEAQKKKTPAAYAEAGRWYELYLRAFQESEQAPYMNFLYAELLTSAGSFQQAALQYERTAYDYPSHDKAAEAGYAALLAYGKHEAQLSGDAKARWHRAGIDSALRFVVAFPVHKEALPVRTRAAQQLYALKEYQLASDTAQGVVSNGAAPKDLQYAAWVVIAHSQFDLQDYHRAEAAYQQLLARTPRSDKRRDGYEEKLAASIYKQGEQARAAGDLSAAAGHFLRIADIVPGSAINVTAQYDAAAAYIQLKQWSTAIAILERWRAANPKHELQPDVTRKLAVLYRENAQPQQAAAEFDRIAASEKDPNLKREAMWTAASLYKEANNASAAIRSYKAFVTAFPQPVEQAVEARYQLVRLYEKTGDTPKQRFWQQKIIEADGAAGSQRTDRTRYLAAHSRLALVRDTAAAYKSVALREPLQKNLKLKKKYMQQTVKGYTDAASYEVSEVTTESTYQLAQLYADFGQALMDSERPRNLNAEELEQYDFLLEEQAYPFEEKAIGVHETNAARTVDGVYDGWVRKSLEALAELMPARYARQERSETFVLSLQ